MAKKFSGKTKPTPADAPAGVPRKSRKVARTEILGGDGHEASTATTELRITDITVSADISVRAKLDQEAIQDIADAIRRGARIRPVVVYRDGDTRWLSDGLHSYHGHRAAGRETILAEVREGGKSEALEHAIRANIRNRSVRTTAADLKVAIDNALRDPRLGGWKDHPLSKLFDCDNETITRRRRALTGERVTSRAQEAYRRAKHPIFCPSPNRRPEDEPAYNDWYTPPDFIEAARAALGGTIDLDPASCTEANENVRAVKYYDRASDGLSQPWGTPDGPSRIFLNPPYAIDLLRQFVKKAIAEYEAGNCSEIVILTNVRPEVDWFQRLAESYAVAFTFGRLKFGRPRGEGQDLYNHYGQALFYLGPNPGRFYAAFADAAYVPNGCALREPIAPRADLPLSKTRKPVTTAGARSAPGGRRPRRARRARPDAQTREESRTTPEPV